MDFNIESLPYLFHIELTDSWTHRSKGMFVDPKGTEYRYKDKDGWKSFYETNEVDFNATLDFEVEVPPAISKVEIKPEVLFYNLSLCRTKKPLMSWFSKSKVTVSAEIIEDLINSAVAFTSDLTIHDAPTTTYSLLVYDIENGCYKQILLSSTGNRSMKNSSIYTISMVNRFARL